MANQGNTSKTFYRRPLPTEQIAFESTEGRLVFKEALASGHMEGYFPLASQFHTQNEPAYCGLGTLAMVLNSLSIDPDRVWKGVWRWFSEELLNCCAPLEVVKTNGITFPQFICLAKCNGAQVEARHGVDSSEQEFREKVISATSKASGEAIVISYDRKVLKQTGSGHFSPIGGYCPNRDLVLIMDVARFKYPPHWVPLSTVFESMKTIDQATGLSRGFVVLKPGGKISFFCRLQATQSYWTLFSAKIFEKFPQLLTQKSPSTLEQYLNVCYEFLLEESDGKSLLELFSTYQSEVTGKLTSDYEIYLTNFFNEIKTTTVYKKLSEIVNKNTSDLQLELITVIILGTFEISLNFLK